MPTSTWKNAPFFSEISGEFVGTQWGDVGIAPYGGRKRVSGQMRRGTWPPPYNFRSKELCRAGHTGPATKGAFHIVSGSGAGAETILHLRPLA